MKRSLTHPAKEKFVRGLKTGQQRLLQALFDSIHDGGVTYVAHVLDVDRQVVVHWKKRGAVPFHRIYRVATTLGVPKHALDYEGMRAVCPDCDAWPQFIRKFNFSRGIVNWILSGEPPKDPGELA